MFNTSQSREQLLLVHSEPEIVFVNKKMLLCIAEAAPVSTLVFRFVRTSLLPISVGSDIRFGVVTEHQVTYT